jgi:hypothetical protein
VPRRSSVEAEEELYVSYFGFNPTAYSREVGVSRERNVRQNDLL